MRVLVHSLFATGTFLLALFAACPQSFAFTCDMLATTVDDARIELQRAANETDFEAAKYHTRRAKRALDDAAMCAMDCQCDMAYLEFDTAASHARRASNADLVEEFVDYFSRTIRAFNSAIDALSICASMRR